MLPVFIYIKRGALLALPSYVNNDGRSDERLDEVVILSKGAIFLSVGRQIRRLFTMNRSTDQSTDRRTPMSTDSDQSTSSSSVSRRGSRRSSTALSTCQSTDREKNCFLLVEEEDRCRVP